MRRARHDEQTDAEGTSARFIGTTEIGTKNEKHDSELERISGDIDSALGACNDLKNAFCIPLLLHSISKKETVTIDTLRGIARLTSSELCSPCCRVLDTVEEKPQLIAPTLLIAKGKLEKLPNTDWRKHAFTTPLQECEKTVLGTQVPVADIRQ